MPTSSKTGRASSRRVASRPKPAPARPRRARAGVAVPFMDASYHAVLGSVAELVEVARGVAARSVNALMTATYWAIGRRIVEAEQQGKARAPYGEALIDRLAGDLTARFGRGFGARNLFQMRGFYLAYRQKVQTVSAGSGRGRGRGRGKLHTMSAESSLAAVAGCFPLPWSRYVRLLGVESTEARSFYETEALRSGWTVRQLDRQIGTQFYERTALSRNKAAMLRRGEVGEPSDGVSIEEQIKDPFVLEFLGLKDEHSETDLEEALKVLAAEYRTTLPDERLLAEEVERTRKLIEEGAQSKGRPARKAERAPEAKRRRRQEPGPSARR